MVPLTTLNQLIDFNESQQAGHAIECDLSAIISNPIDSTFLKWAFELLSWMQNLHKAAQDY
jgi:hypothetical protein